MQAQTNAVSSQVANVQRFGRVADQVADRLDNLIVHRGSDADKVKFMQHLITMIKTNTLSDLGFTNWSQYYKERLHSKDFGCSVFRMWVDAATAIYQNGIELNEENIDIVTSIARITKDHRDKALQEYKQMRSDSKHDDKSSSLIFRALVVAYDPNTTFAKNCGINVQKLAKEIVVKHNDTGLSKVDDQLIEKTEVADKVYSPRVVEAFNKIVETLSTVEKPTLAIPSVVDTSGVYDQDTSDKKLIVFFAKNNIKTFTVNALIETTHLSLDTIIEGLLKLQEDNIIEWIDSEDNSEAFIIHLESLTHFFQDAYFIEQIKKASSVLRHNTDLLHLVKKSNFAEGTKLSAQALLISVLKQGNRIIVREANQLISIFEDCSLIKDDLLTKSFSEIVCAILTELNEDVSEAVTCEVQPTQVSSSIIDRVVISKPVPEGQCAYTERQIALLRLLPTKEPRLIEALEALNKFLGDRKSNCIYVNEFEAAFIAQGYVDAAKLARWVINSFEEADLGRYLVETENESAHYRWFKKNGFNRPYTLQATIAFMKG